MTTPPDALQLHTTTLSEEGPGLVFCHGLFGQGRNWTAIAKQFGRTRSSMYRVVNEVRAKELVNTTVDYIYNAEFDDPSREAAMLAEMPGHAEFEAKRAGKTPPKDVPPQMMHLYEWPLLSKEQEQHHPPSSPQKQQP